MVVLVLFGSAFAYFGYEMSRDGLKLGWLMFTIGLAMLIPGLIVRFT